MSLQGPASETPAATTARVAPVSSTRSEASALVLLSLPIVAGLAGHSALSVIDSWMLAPLGEQALAAASLAMTVLMVFYAALYGFVGSIAVLGAISEGQSSTPRAQAVLRTGLFYSAVIGCVAMALMAVLLWGLPHIGQPTDVLAIIPNYWLITAATLPFFSACMAIKIYLEATGRPWTAALLCAVPALISIPAHAILVFGWRDIPAFGLTGSALANLLSIIVGLLAMLVAVQGRLIGAERATKADRKALLKEGLTMCAQYTAEGGAVTVVGLAIGLLGATALAANQIASSLGVLLFMAPVGLSAAVMIRIAQALGDNKPEAVRRIAVVALVMCVAVMAVFAVAMISFATPLAKLFVSEPELVSTTASVIVVMGLMQVFDGLQSVSLGALRGIFDNTYATVVSLLTYWVVALPLGLVFGFLLDLGAAGVWAGFAVGLAIAAFLLSRRLMSQVAKLT